MEGLQSSLDEAVCSTRNYVLAGDERNLDRFATAKTSTTQTLARGCALTEDNAVQQKRVQQLEPQLTATFQYWEDAIAKRKGGDSAAADQLISSLILDQTCSMFMRVLASQRQDAIRAFSGLPCLSPILSISSFLKCSTPKWRSTTLLLRYPAAQPLSPVPDAVSSPKQPGSNTPPRLPH
jgi:hypothetical protein